PPHLLSFPTRRSSDLLRGLWSAISPMPYFDQFSRWPKKSLIIYAKYDLTFLPEFSRQVVDQFARHNLDHKVVVLPCGHYTTGERSEEHTSELQYQIIS